MTTPVSAPRPVQKCACGADCGHHVSQRAGHPHHDLREGEGDMTDSVSAVDLIPPGSFSDWRKAGVPVREGHQ